MEDDPVKIVFGVLGFGVICIVMVGAFSIMAATLSETQCRPYMDTISQKDITISTLNASLNQTTSMLIQCNNNYNRLVNENITKQDFVEIKGYYNLTQIQITSLDQKFEQIVNNYNKIYNKITNRYTISIGLNIAFGIEILSFLFFKGEIILLIINLIRGKKEKEQKPEHTEHHG
ncbi:MAG TPA: hypothetical protein VHA12_00195 [Candidatus Nanoarchaeia archaeon]|nr:hypothetical protein [Candidatus Nanoarchaeia archaeon]